MGLSILNRGTTDTCVRQLGGSVVDITFASPALARRVQGWEVLEEAETLSDHRYIRFDVCRHPELPSTPRRSPNERSPRWALKQLDRELLLEAAIVQSWIPRPEGTVDVEQEVEWFSGAMTRICDASMPRAKPLSPRGGVYWWSAELSQLRVDCVAARREYLRQRRRRRRDEPRERELYASYRAAATTLQNAIANAKDEARSAMVETLDRNPWGRPYRLVRSKLRTWAPPLTQNLQPQFLGEVVNTLFPNTEDHTPPRMVRDINHDTGDDEEVPRVSDGELGAAVARLRSKNTAPGLDGIPGRVWVLALESLDSRFKELLSACLEQGCFPHRWKTGKLVLLRKEGRPADSPAAYRPIVLLEEANKLFERIIASRLTKHLDEVGPNLADCQYGFRRGRSTIDAISRVKAMAEQAVSGGEVVLAVSLDIANAFNTLPWNCIKEALRFHRVPLYLYRIVEAYLSDRYVAYPGRVEWGRRQMSCGVPQGSVLGPLLWNIGYDWVLRGANLRGVDVVCYADDTLVLARGRTHRAATILATAGVAQVVGRIRQLGLEVALNKSEALCFHGPRNAPPPGAKLVVGGVSIDVGSTMKYLGLVLDSRWSFKEHFRRLAPKLIGAASALGSLLPNLGGPGSVCRRLYTGVVRSMALYGAPIWSDSLSVHNKTLLRRPQRVMAVRVIRGYRTISFEAACVLAGVVPWDLDAQVLTVMYRRVTDCRSREEFPPPEVMRRWRIDARQSAFRQWKERLEQPNAGHLTIEAVRPVLKEWVERKYGVLSFRLVQVLTGHGCFGHYLCRVARREETPTCHQCGHADDTSQHTLVECPEWDADRVQLQAIVGPDLSLPAVVSEMVDNERSWEAVRTFCENVMAQKEAAERVREEEAPPNSQRRRRVGRRRLAHERQIPP